MHFEHNCGLLNWNLEVHNAASAEWAHGVLDAEEVLGLPAHLLPDNPFERPREPKKQSYRKSIRAVLVRLILRLDKITEAKNKRLHLSAVGPDPDPHQATPWFTGGSRRAHYAKLLENYDALVIETNFRTQQFEAARADEAAAVLSGLDLNLDRNAATAEAGRVKIEEAKSKPKVQHYFTRCESGRIVVNYEYVGLHDALFTEAELREFDRLTTLGACTAEDCECPGNPSSDFHSLNDGDERLANLSGRNLAHFVPAVPIRPKPEPETNRGSATYIVLAAGMSDGETDDDEVFDIGRVIPDVPVPSTESSKKLT